MNDHPLVVLFESHTRPGPFRDFDPSRNQQCLYLSPPDVRWCGSCKNTLEGSLLPCIHDYMVPVCSTILQVSPHAMGSGAWTVDGHPLPCWISAQQIGPMTAVQSASGRAREWAVIARNGLFESNAGIGAGTV